MGKGVTTKKSAPRPAPRRASKPKASKPAARTSKPATTAKPKAPKDKASISKPEAPARSSVLDNITAGLSETQGPSGVSNTRREETIFHKGLDKTSRREPGLSQGKREAEKMLAAEREAKKLYSEHGVGKHKLEDGSTLNISSKEHKYFKPGVVENNPSWHDNSVQVTKPDGSSSTTTYVPEANQKEYPGGNLTTMPHRSSHETVSANGERTKLEEGSLGITKQEWDSQGNRTNNDKWQVSGRREKMGQVVFTDG